MPLACTSQGHRRKEESHLHLRWTQVFWDEKENVREAVGPQEWLQE